MAQPLDAALRKPDSSRPIVVIGSINMDLVCRVAQIPRPGETILGNDFVTIPGGKGANQAVAAAKLAREPQRVYFIGRVGDDDFGERLLNGLVHHQVVTQFVTVTEGAPSGIAMILVDGAGENSIVVSRGANARLRPRDLDAAESVIATASVVLMQLEIPNETVLHAIAMCRRHGVHSILDPSPAAIDLPRGMYDVDVLTPNQTDAEALLGVERSSKVRRKGVIDPKQVATELLARGPRSIVLKLGRKGAMLLERSGEIVHADSFTSTVVDTTAAGDAFAGALAVAHAEAESPLRALHFANAAGALCCQRLLARNHLCRRVPQLKSYYPHTDEPPAAMLQ